MEKSKIVIKGSIRGISADFIKNILFILVNLIIYFICKAYKGNLYTKHNIDVSFFKYLLEFENWVVVSILAFLYLIIIIIVILTISTIIKTFGLLYSLSKSITFDYTTGRITEKYFSFPISSTVDENKFNEIINVNIEQSIVQKLFNTGTIYIEYLTYTTVDSQLRHAEIQCVAMPFEEKSKLM